jgi:ABC-type ATPase with predicted acetyltransferase domain
MYKTKIQSDDIVEQIKNNFTIEQDELEFIPHKVMKSDIPENFNIGIIVGKSGSGKSILLKDFGQEKAIEWDSRPIASHFKDYNDAEERLLGAGLASIPTWLKPYSVLSNGEKHRADLARIVSNGVVVDEFISYVDNNAALGVANSIGKYIRKNDFKSCVFATLNREIIEYIDPCWVYDTDTRKLTINKKYYDVEFDDVITFKKTNPVMYIN